MKKLNEKSIENINEMLEDAQSNSKVRKLTANDVISLIDKAEAEVKKFPKWMRSAFSYTNLYLVAKSYFGTGHFTKVTFDFSSDGKAKNIRIDRGNCGKYAEAENVLIINSKVFCEHYEIEKMSEKLENFMYKNHGLTKTGKHYF